MAYFNYHDRVATLRDGRILAWSRRIVGVVAPGNIATLIRFPDLKYVEYVLQVEVDAVPCVDVSLPIGKKITGNVVGMTLRTGAGTTLTVDAIAIGPP